MLSVFLLHIFVPEKATACPGVKAQAIHVLPDRICYTSFYEVKSLRQLPPVEMQALQSNK